LRRHVKLTFGGNTWFHLLIYHPLDLQDYIDSGIIESYLLGLASVEEEALLERMRYIYPELETEIAMAEYRLQRVTEEGGVTPPAKVWNKITARISWERLPRGKRPSPENPTYILQPRNYTMTVSIWWRCAVIAMGMIIIALTATTIYFYNRFHQMEDRFLRTLSHIEQQQQTHR